MPYRFSGLDAGDNRAIDHINDFESFVTENDSHRGFLSPPLASALDPSDGGDCRS